MTRTIIAFVTSLAFIGTTLNLEAGTRIWDGGSPTSGNWSTPANWYNNIAPSPGDFLIFPSGTPRLVSTNNFASNTMFGGIIFQGDNFSIYGNTVTITNHVTADAGANGIVFRPGIRLGATYVYLRAQGSGQQLAFQGEINLNGHNLTFVSKGELWSSGVISGTGSVTSSGSGKTVFNGISSNTYTGSTYVTDGVLELSKYLLLFPGPVKFGRTAVPGNLYVGSNVSSLISDAVVCQANGQIASGAIVTLRSTGELNLNGYNNTIQYLHADGGYTTTGSGKLTVTGNILCDPDADGSVISGHLDLGAGTTFMVSANALLSIYAEISGAPAAYLIKQGSGELRFNNSNIYEGPTTVDGGMLRVFADNALGSGTNGVTLEAGQLVLGNSAVSGKTLTVNGAATLASSGASSLWNGDIDLAGYTLTVQTPSSSDLVVSGVISGSGNIRKMGPGLFRMVGTEPNTFSGFTTVHEGTLELYKFLNQQNVVSIPGLLVIGDGYVTPGDALVRHGGPGQVADTAQVMVYEDGEWDLNSWHDKVAGLTLEGGLVQTYTGTLELGGDVLVNASTNLAIINGHLDLGGAPRMFTLNDGPLPYELAISATISGGSGSALIKDGAGAMGIVGDTSNTYSGDTIVNQGLVRLSKLPGLIAIPGNLAIGNAVDGFNAAIVSAAQNELIANASVVTVHESGLLDLDGHNNTIGPLVMRGPGSVITGVGTLVLGGDITVDQSSGPAVITGNLSLGSSTRTFHVADGNDAYDLYINASISGASGAGWIKTGPGSLRLGGANTFDGPANVMEGALYVWNTDALGAASAGTTLANNTSLTLGLNVSVGAEPLTLGNNTSFAFTSANSVWAGDITLNGNTGFRSVNLTPTEDLELSGAISGPGSLTLIAGQLLLSGNAPNTYNGTTTVLDHTLVLNKDPGVVAVPGALIVGNNVNADTVRLESNEQIADTAPVYVASQAVLNLNSHDETIGSLEGAGDVTMGSGTLTVGEDNTSTLFSGIISGAGAVLKTGTGALRLTGNHTYSDSTRLLGGTLQVDGSLASPVVDVHSGGILGGTGSVQEISVQSGGVVSPGASPGMLSAAGNVEFLGGAFNAELNGTTAGVNHDQLTAAGKISLMGPLNVALGYSPSTNDTFTILNNTGTEPIIGNFDGLAEGALFSVGGHEFQITYAGGDGNDVVLTVPQTPESPTLSIIPAGPGMVQISWSPDTSGFGLQESTNLTTANWVNSPSGTNNPVIVPASGNRFFRLLKP